MTTVVVAGAYNLCDDVLSNNLGVPTVKTVIKSDLIIFKTRFNLKRLKKIPILKLIDGPFHVVLVL